MGWQDAKVVKPRWQDAKVVQAAEPAKPDAGGFYDSPDGSKSRRVFSAAPPVLESAGSTAPVVAPDRERDWVEPAVLGAIKAATVGADRPVAAMSATVQDKMHGDNTPFWDLYRQNRGLYDQFSAERFGENPAASIAGGLATGLGPGLFARAPAQAAKAALSAGEFGTMLARAPGQAAMYAAKRVAPGASPLVFGGLQGGMSGLVSGPSDLTTGTPGEIAGKAWADTLGGAETGAELGGALALGGAAAQKVLPGIRDAGLNLGRRFWSGGMSKFAARKQVPAESVRATMSPTTVGGVEFPAALSASPFSGGYEGAVGRLSQTEQALGKDLGRVKQTLAAAGVEGPQAEADVVAGIRKLIEGAEEHGDREKVAVYQDWIDRIQEVKMYAPGLPERPAQGPALGLAQTQVPAQQFGRALSKDPDAYLAPGAAPSFASPEKPLPPHAFSQDPAPNRYSPVVNVKQPIGDYQGPLEALTMPQQLARATMASRAPKPPAAPVPSAEVIAAREAAAMAEATGEAVPTGVAALAQPPELVKASPLKLTELLASRKQQTPLQALYPGTEPPAFPTTPNASGHELILERTGQKASPPAKSVSAGGSLAYPGGVVPATEPTPVYKIPRTESGALELLPAERTKTKVDSMVDYGLLGDRAKNEAFKDVANVIRSANERAITAQASKAPAAAAAFEPAKDAYAPFAGVSELAAEGLARKLSRNTFSLPEYLATAGAVAHSGPAGLAAIAPLHLIKSSIPAMAKGLTLGSESLMSPAIRERWSNYATLTPAQVVRSDAESHRLRQQAIADALRSGGNQ